MDAALITVEIFKAEGVALLRREHGGVEVYELHATADADPEEVDAAFDYIPEECLEENPLIFEQAGGLTVRIYRKATA
ncbi:hypothetical protein ACFWY5_29580 [Nonomuraea sp. NPDC059007]|uniref:hypothetical protein n=1 Tax=Nonomuraea sp. NPDC059007 TaxID=3346692 RepID=UPI0036A28642